MDRAQLALTFGLYGLMKKLVQVESAPGLFVETALVALPAAVVLARPARVRQRHVRAGQPGAIHCSWPAAGAATAIPLLLFAAAARRIPLSTVGLLQYLTPLMQLSIGVFVYDEPMPPARLAGFAIVWLALGGVHSRHVATRPGTKSTCRPGGRSRPVSDGRSDPRPEPLSAASGKCRTPALRSATNRSENAAGRRRTGEGRAMNDDPGSVVSPPRPEGPAEAYVQVAAA